jgi:hypothetical protein
MNDIKGETRLAKVVHVVTAEYATGPFEFVINHGSRHGVQAGDRFLVFGTGPHIADPDTGEDLGVRELVRGPGVVVHVQERMATIRTTERRRTRPAKRIIREQSWTASLLSRPGVPAGVVEEEIAPEAEIPFVLCNSAISPN